MENISETEKKIKKILWHTLSFSSPIKSEEETPISMCNLLISEINDDISELINGGYLRVTKYADDNQYFIVATEKGLDKALEFWKQERQQLADKFCSQQCKNCDFIHNKQVQKILKILSNEFGEKVYNIAHLQCSKLLNKR